MYNVQCTPVTVHMVAFQAEYLQTSKILISLNYHQCALVLQNCAQRAGFMFGLPAGMDSVRLNFIEINTVAHYICWILCWILCFQG